jgi:menaquinone-specific isochorismate synthase
LIIQKDLFYKFTSKFNADQTPQETIYNYSQGISEHEYNKIIPHLFNCSKNCLYWNKPDDFFSFLAIDKIVSIKNDISSQFNSLEDRIKNLSKLVISNIESGNNSKLPLFVGAIKFPSAYKENIWNDFESIEWFIPKIIFLKVEEQYSLIINVLASEVADKHLLDGIESILSPQDEFSLSFDKVNSEQSKIISLNSNVDLLKWTIQVNSALQKISKGDHKKVVLARYNEIEFEKRTNIFPHLKFLEQTYSNCYTFAFRSGDSIFLGASPEKLFKIENGLLETDALAGSIKRGGNEVEDQNLEDKLLHDTKNLTEQKSVLDYILNQLTPFADKILFDSQPVIKKLSNIQHLHSVIRAKLKHDTTVTSLIEKLFPTPAVCGFPKEAALDTINELEKFERGLYTGVIGWFNSYNSEFAVGIRSAILNKEKLRAYAGCGIIEGSEANSEFNETELKLKPILSLFTNETISQL